MKNEYKQAAIDMIKIPPSNKIIKMALKILHISQFHQLCLFLKYTSLLKQI